MSPFEASEMAVPRLDAAPYKAPPPKSDRWVVLGAQIAIVAVTVGLWELAVARGWITEFFFGKPSEVVRYLVTRTTDGYLVTHTWVTLYEELLGFIAGTVVGTAAGLSLWWSPFLSRVLEPFAVVFNATPKIVIAPLLVVWFGVGLVSKVMIAVLICAIVAWLGAFDGVRSADKDQMDMVRAVGGKRRHVFWKIVVPGSLPWILTTLRINIGLALIGVITGEFLSSTAGLGYLVDSTAKLYQMSHTIAALVLIAAIAAAQFYFVNWLERRLIPWAEDYELEFIT
jgi:NitT/TauT family transport system permease protein